MKKVLLMLSAIVLFAACNKDETGEKNKITFGNETADIVVNACGYLAENHFIGVAGYHFDADFTLNGDNCHIFTNVSATGKGKKTDLGKEQTEVGYSFEINSSSEKGYPYDIHAYCYEYSGGKLEHSSVGTWFKSGTLELKDDGKTLILNVKGTLADGRAFSMNITTESKKFE